MSKEEKISELMSIAGVHHQSGEFEKVIELLEQILEINPKHTLAWTRMTIVYGEMGNFQKAIKCCESIIEYNSQDRIAWNVMGAAYRDLRNYPKAIECWEKVLELDPDNELVEKAINVLRKRFPINDQIALPCNNDNPCPYDYSLNPDRDIEGMPFIDNDTRSCPDYGHICPEFMEDLGLSIEDLEIRAVFHCALIYIRTKEMDKTLQEDEDEGMKTMLDKYKEFSKKYSPTYHPEYFY